MFSTVACKNQGVPQRLCTPSLVTELLQPSETSKLWSLECHPAGCSEIRLEERLFLRTIEFLRRAARWLCMEYVDTVKNQTSSDSFPVRSLKPTHPRLRTWRAPSTAHAVASLSPLVNAANSVAGPTTLGMVSSCTRLLPGQLQLDGVVMLGHASEAGCKFRLDP